MEKKGRIEGRNGEERKKGEVGRDGEERKNRGERWSRKEE